MLFVFREEEALVSADGGSWCSEKRDAGGGGREAENVDRDWRAARTSPWEVCIMWTRLMCDERDCQSGRKLLREVIQIADHVNLPPQSSHSLVALLIIDASHNNATCLER